MGILLHVAHALWPHLVPVFAAGAVMLGVLIALPSVASAGSSLNKYERELVQLINEERTDRDLPKLHVHDRLTAAAQAHSADMGERQYFEHDTMGGETWRKRLQSFGYAREDYDVWKAGENIGWGAGLSSSPVRIVDQWMKSPAHRAVILKKCFRDVGVGAVSCDGYGAVEGMVWFFTFDAGRRR